MRVNSSIVLILLFGVHISASSEGIRFGTELTGMEMDNEVELMKIFQPVGLVAGKKFGGGKVLKILVVSDHIDRGSRALKIMPPRVESFIDSQ